MIINKESKIIFSCPLKTGSHTIYSTIQGSKFLVSQHATYSEVKEKEPDLYQEIISDYTKYITIRNPWSHAVSNYMHNLLERHNPELFETNCSEEIKECLKTFSNFLRSRYYVPQEDVSFKDSLFSYDKVLKFENLNKELENLCKSLGTVYERHHVYSGLDPKRVYFFNRTYPKNYRDIYNQEDIEFVRNRAKNEIRIFNYKF